jgi:biotin transport system substrate-specific component
MRENILINKLVKEKSESRITELLLIISGAIFLGMTARISILLPFTPVPITGQTFGVLMIGLVYGRKLGLKTIGSYIAAGMAGLPFFSTTGPNILFLKPTGGYLIGYVFMVLICGYLTEKGWGKSYVKTFGIMLLAETAMYICGIIHLSFFVKGNVLEMGLYPFIIGDLFKMAVVGLSVPSIWKALDYFKK